MVWPEKRFWHTEGGVALLVEAWWYNAHLVYSCHITSTASVTSRTPPHKKIIMEFSSCLPSLPPQTDLNSSPLSSSSSPSSSNYPSSLSPPLILYLSPPLPHSEPSAAPESSPLNWLTGSQPCVKALLWLTISPTSISATTRLLSPNKDNNSSIYKVRGRAGTPTQLTEAGLGSVGQVDLSVGLHYVRLQEAAAQSESQCQMSQFDLRFLCQGQNGRIGHILSFHCRYELQSSQFYIHPVWNGSDMKARGFIQIFQKKTKLKCNNVTKIRLLLYQTSREGERRWRWEGARISIFSSTYYWNILPCFAPLINPSTRSWNFDGVSLLRA